MSAKYALPAVPQYDTAACRFFSCRSAVLFPLISPNKNCAGFRQQNKTAVRKQLLFPLAAGTKGTCFFCLFFQIVRKKFRNMGYAHFAAFLVQAASDLHGAAGAVRNNAFSLRFFNAADFVAEKFFGNFGELG